MRLRWTAQARADLRSVDAWLTAKADGGTAARMLQAIRDRSSRLSEYPAIGPALEEGGSTRFLPVLGTPFILVYAAGPTEVIILRVRHAREDWRAE